MQSIQYRTLVILFLFLLNVGMYVVCEQPQNIWLALSFIFVTVLILVNSFFKAWKNQCIIHLISVANVFIFAIFVLRPLQLLLTTEQNQFSTLRLYFTYYGYLLPSEFPWAQASFIGMLGTFFLNFSFLTTSQKDLFRVLPQQECKTEYTFSKGQWLGLLGFVVISIISAGGFLFKMQMHIPIHIYDLLWIFIFSCICIYCISRKRGDSWGLYFVLGLSVLLLSYCGRRQYIVNLLLCCIVPLYFMGKERRKTFAKIFLLFFTLLIIVFVYGIIRRSMIGGLEHISFVKDILGEFCMYDMLLCSLDYVNGYRVGAFGGYHYLNIFTIGIPGLYIQPFDHFLTDIVFKGNFQGGIPTSLFGSLYFNFLLPGVCVGSFILGVFLMHMQKKLAKRTTYEGIGYYALMTTFVYDLIRVGDIGREVWSLITLLLVYKGFIFIMNKLRKESLEDIQRSPKNEQKLV